MHSTQPSTIGRAGSSAAARVVLAEDDEMVRRSLARGLGQDGYEVLQAENGAEALELIEKFRPELVVTDLRMPVLDGISMIEQVRSRCGSSPYIIVLTGESAVEERLAAFDAGADDFVPKPANIPELQRRARAALRLIGMNEDLRRAREESERLRLYSEEATALLAHDLNNGFCVALANMDYLLEVVSLGDEELRALASSRSAVSRMAGLVSNFVDVSRIEGGVVVDRRKTDISELVRVVIGIHGCALDRARCTVELDVDDDLRPELDPVLMERVLHNLVGNAIRYGAEGQLEVAVRSEVGPDGARMLLQVSNEGAAIPDSVRDEMFEKYTRDSSDKRSRGMGLYFVRLVCEAHGGSIRLLDDSERTTFEISIPLQQGQE